MTARGQSGYEFPAQVHVQMKGPLWQGAGYMMVAVKQPTKDATPLDQRTA